MNKGEGHSYAYIGHVGLGFKHKFMPFMWLIMITWLVASFFKRFTVDNFIVDK